MHFSIFRLYLKGMKLFLILSKFFGLFLCFSLFTSCADLSWNKFKDKLNLTKKKNMAEEILQTLTFLFWGEFNHELYKFVPIPFFTLKSQFNADQFILVNPGLKENKPKIILIHGWDFKEKNTQAPTDKFSKVTNLRETWDDVLEMYSQNISGVQSSYELYAFTYRTSDYVENNGKRLIDKLNAVFTSNDKVILLAHSMGGLVGRSALYHSNNTNDVIDLIVTLGTPYLGSPFASSSYQGNFGKLGDLIAFMTGSEGGKDLAYTNALGTSYQVPTPNEYINGAFNPYLERLLAESSKDSKIIAFYGEMSVCNNHPGSDTIYTIGCGFLSEGNPSFANKSDGIVSSTSAKMSSKLPGAKQFPKDFDHAQLSFRNHVNTISRNAYFNEVLSVINTQ
ncbi:PGAP1-like protein [Leptospira borgpetersenii serovar Javanica str. UI 09931]|uniref:PGAP1-like protein n=1 Tax=Leptospira borgpetersenii serovar Javanica str. UI 09931 TaxID=1049767 RepID=A0AAV3JEU0_LEPBO|nr:PGAP1-like protein [Leptospira borgpetersenii serovar Castellonis str. 200801910]EMN11609.1 PGAP1-like protein [Leptospira borgpetersenii str. Brem 307]EMN58406.1 PGAP1-like protein [Leptospira borgpetersenii serovar Javanica str. MK146]EPG59156.1 PGAP1-like protein [Leptospira borgpetersenii serovar Javanica str. UI 09931]